MVGNLQRRANAGLTPSPFASSVSQSERDYILPYSYVRRVRTPKFACLAAREIDTLDANRSLLGMQRNGDAAQSCWRWVVPEAVITPHNLQLATHHPDQTRELVYQTWEYLTVPSSLCGDSVPRSDDFPETCGLDRRVEGERERDRTDCIMPSDGRQRGASVTILKHALQWYGGRKL